VSRGKKTEISGYSHQQQKKQKRKKKKNKKSLIKKECDNNKHLATLDAFTVWGKGETFSEKSNNSKPTDSSGNQPFGDMN